MRYLCRLDRGAEPESAGGESIYLSEDIRQIVSRWLPMAEMSCSFS